VEAGSSVGKDLLVATIRLPLERLVFDRSVWPRDAWDADRINLFAELYESGEELPPIEVVPRTDGTYLIADGVHRYNATRKLGRSELDVTVVMPDQGEAPETCAYRRALATATQSALPMTTAEKKRATVRLLKDGSGLSHRAIARLVGVSHDTVDRWSALLADSANGSNSKGSSAPVVPTGKTVNSNGVLGSSTTQDDSYSTVGEAARILVRDLVALRDARGFWEKVAPSLMRGYLADEFEEQFGTTALDNLRLLATWTAQAVKALEARLRSSQSRGSA
jgi:hypothetical protein